MCDDTGRDDLGDLWEEELEKMISELWETVKDHPDECDCRDCLELEILAFK